MQCLQPVSKQAVVSLLKSLSERNDRCLIIFIECLNVSGTQISNEIRGLNRYITAEKVTGVKNECGQLYLSIFY